MATGKKVYVRREGNRIFIGQVGTFDDERVMIEMSMHDAKSILRGLQDLIGEDDSKNGEREAEWLGDDQQEAR